MKRISLFFCALALFVVLLVGCGSGGPYSIIDRQEGSGIKTVYVEAPAGASQSELEGWAHEIEASEKVSGKDFVVNFYNGGRGAQNMVANYSGNTLNKTR